MRRETRDAPAALAEQSVEREAVYRAIEALDEDFETGKLSSDDHARMRAELRAEAVALLQSERSAAAPKPVAAPVCPGCGTAVRIADRFCSQCGAPLERAPQTGAGGT